MERISTRALKPCDVPAKGARWAKIEQFALTFDGQKHWGSLGRCAQIANARRARTLNELRTCLFFEQRRWRHFGLPPDRKAMRYIRGLVEQIRKRLASR
jgi:hypothetical protein